MKKPIHYIGLDVHADSLTMAIAEEGRTVRRTPFRGGTAQDETPEG